MPFISKNDRIINRCRYDKTKEPYEKACGYIFEDGWREIASTSIKNADGTYKTSVYPKKIYNQGYTKYDNINPESQNYMTSCFKTKNEDGTKISFKYTVAGKYFVSDHENLLYTVLLLESVYFVPSVR